VDQEKPRDVQEFMSAGKTWTMYKKVGIPMYNTIS